ncbi:MAG TPA: Ig-like domain-containing protein [Actinomycetota bacterium]
MSRGVARTAVFFVVASLVPLVATVASAGADDHLPGLVVTSPVPDGFEGFGALRLRAIGSTANTGDGYLGVADLGVAQNRIEANFTVPRFLPNGNTGSATVDCQGNYQVGGAGSPATNQLRFTWDRANDAIVARLTNATLDCVLTFQRFTQELATAKGWTLAQTRDALEGVNALLVVVDSRQVGASVVLREAAVDGAAGIGTLDPGAGAERRWLATGYDFDTQGGFRLDAGLDLAGSFNACLDTCGVEIRFGHVEPANDPPVVSLAAQDAAGSEGDTLATGGSFTDPDGDPLQLSASGDGTFVDHGDGTWSWTLASDDDGDGAVVVTADDGNGGETSDRFGWSATNVAPTIASLQPSATTVLTGTEVVWTASASDPGTADELTWSFDGGVGTAAGATTTYATRYDACGTYGLAAAVADDDGGDASATSGATVTVIGASLLEPILTDGITIGPRGRTIPLKLRVGCESANVPGLAPEVWFRGEMMGRMRLQEGFYRFNLAFDGPGTIRIAPFGPGGGTVEMAARLR